MLSGLQRLANHPTWLGETAGRHGKDENGAELLRVTFLPTSRHRPLPCKQKKIKEEFPSHNRITTSVGYSPDAT